MKRRPPGAGLLPGLRTDVGRARWRLSALAVAGLGLLSLVVGLAAPGLSGDLTPRTVVPGAVVPLPRRGPFTGATVLYGVPAAAGRTPLGRLGCAVLSPSGAPGGRLGDDDLDQLDRPVIDGRAVLPLARVEAGDGGRLQCAGTGVQGALVVANAAGVAPLVPMAAYCLAALGLVLGGAGVVRLAPVR